MNQVDINKIIDDAIEKKDRSVSIFINGDNVSVYVEPLEKYDPRWIIRERPASGKYSISKRQYECSECHVWSDVLTSYCGYCGEKLRLPVEEDIEKEDTK